MILGPLDSKDFMEIEVCSAESFLSDEMQSAELNLFWVSF